METFTVMTGLDQKELGLYATELNNADLVALARSIAQLVCLQKGFCTIDDVRTHPKLKEWQPSSPNTWGSVFHCKGWRLIGYEPSHIKSNHTRRVGRWVWQPSHGAAG